MVVWGVGVPIYRRMPIVTKMSSLGKMGRGFR